MNSLTFFKWLCLVLGVMNMILLTFFMMAPPPPHNRLKPFRDIVVKELKLSPEQQDSYFSSTITHNQQMKRLNLQEHKLILDYFRTLTDDDDKIARKTLLNQIKELESKKLEVSYQHFEEIKAICDEEQKDRFPRVMRRAIEFLVIKNN